MSVEEFKDGLNPKPTLLITHNDHSVSISLALIGSKVEGIQLNDPGCVFKTCPLYSSLLESLHSNIRHL
ncbi:hypothetical protein IC620_16715 [Hazenella sp. IB182357]|uniref:Uncharacterized protein n=1 Tax=Polycladospora coralii TaxID=2771432 RepID=A0A926NEK7_9BACL|nr:hypothetical protein [Polycladospora coralii]